jgi:Zn-dependent protease/CBS domain-containing protein
MNASLNIGKIWGIPISLHLSWFLVFGLVTWSLAIGYFPQEYPQLNSAVYFFLALITSLLFFGSVLAHELGHSLLAIRNQIPVKGITLFIFGGVAQIAQEPRSPGAEFRIAIAGPLVSLVLAIIFGGLWLFDQAIPYLAAPSFYLARINLILALFNLIPGFPLDGGRVLRALVWQFTGNFQRATRVASFSGQLVAFGFIGFGIFSIFDSNFFNGLWLVFIGWFLQNAAASAYAQMNLSETLSGVTVEQAMTRDCVEIPLFTPISQLVEERVLNGGQRCFIVTDGNRLEGILTLRDITALPQKKWRFTTAGQIMIPSNRLAQVEPGLSLLNALQIMDNAQIAQVPVVQNDQLVGMLSREQVLHYLHLRTQLGI